MADEPTNRELLERIISLEKENATLRAMHDDLVKGWRSSCETNLHQFASIWDVVWPVAEKVMPGLRNMQSKLSKIIPPSDAHPSVDWRPQDYKRAPDQKA